MMNKRWTTNITLSWVSALIVVMMEITVAYAAPVAQTIAALIADKAGHEVNTTRQHSDWGLVYIFSAHCSHCQRFSPLLAAVSSEYALPVYAYSVDGQGLPAYPTPLIADDTLLHVFYGDQAVLYPATFFINVHSKRFVPLTRGALDATALRHTLHTILSNDGVKEALAP